MKMEGAKLPNILSLSLLLCTHTHTHTLWFKAQSSCYVAFLMVKEALNFAVILRDVRNDGHFFSF